MRETNGSAENGSGERIPRRNKKYHSSCLSKGEKKRRIGGVKWPRLHLPFGRCAALRFFTPALPRSANVRKHANDIFDFRPKCISPLSRPSRSLVGQSLRGRTFGYRGRHAGRKLRARDAVASQPGLNLQGTIVNHAAIPHYVAGRWRCVIGVNPGESKINLRQSNSRAATGIALQPRCRSISSIGATTKSRIKNR